ncbi:MAG: hypothetical protein Q8S73_12450 [Deltaproteobacteria bacterium]|nr:hypothetical protein [Myxococcales bacterium]MDP3214910.1 hypothetical protein [Deltaproteobacteria bacterium]
MRLSPDGTWRTAVRDAVAPRPRSRLRSLLVAAALAASSGCAATVAATDASAPDAGLIPDATAPTDAGACPHGRSRCGRACIDPAAACRPCGAACPTGLCADGACVVAVEVVAGFNMTCARLSDRTVRCWGENHNGILGDSTIDLRRSPHPIAGLAGAVQLTTSRHNCALIEDGTVQCWGNNSFGELGGRSSAASDPTPGAVPGLQGVVQLACGGRHTCAVLADATVRCWGRNSFGELGDGTATNLRPTPVAVTGLTGVAQVVTAWGYSCAGLLDGTVRCWGTYNAPDLLGAGAADRRRPFPVVGLAGVTQLSSTAGAHVCAVTSDGAVRCWGSNYWGELGDGTTIDRLSPTATVGLTGVVGVAAGYRRTCAALADGTARCWGDNSFGELGDGTVVNPRTSPRPVVGLGGVAAVTTGLDHSCALLTNGSVRCWGDNSHGETGVGSMDLTVTAPRPVAW